jgi:hypothetical protein
MSRHRTQKNDPDPFPAKAFADAFLATLERDLGRPLARRKRP